MDEYFYGLNIFVPKHLISKLSTRLHIGIVHNISFLLHQYIYKHILLYNAP